jgi:hypothetical protein
MYTVAYSWFGSSTKLKTVHVSNVNCFIYDVFAVGIVK